LTIGREHCGPNRITVSLQRGEQVTIRCIPDARGVVPTCSNYALAVGGK
jgi:hypothetical protein